MDTKNIEKEVNDEMFPKLNLIPKNSENKDEISDLSVSGKIAFNDFKTSISSKYKISKDPETNSFISYSDIAFYHQISSWMKFSLIENKNIFKLCTSMSPVNNFLLTTKLDLDNTEKITSVPINVIAKYKFKNNLSLQLGIKDFNLIKEKTPSCICAGFSKPFNLWRNNKLSMEVLLNYSLNDKYFKSNNFKFDINNSYLKSLFSFGFNKKNKNSKSEKNVKFKGEINVSNKFSLGTEVNYNSEDSKGTKVQLFSKYIMDQFTNFLGKWDDKDKSVTLKMEHDFRGLIKLGIISKFTPVEGDKKTGGFCKLPPFNTKTGISLDISEPLL